MYLSKHTAFIIHNGVVPVKIRSHTKILLSLKVLASLIKQANEEVEMQTLKERNKSWAYLPVMILAK